MASGDTTSIATVTHASALLTIGPEAGSELSTHNTSCPTTGVAEHTETGTERRGYEVPCFRDGIRPATKP